MNDFDEIMAEFETTTAEFEDSYAAYEAEMDAFVSASAREGTDTLLVWTEVSLHMARGAREQLAEKIAGEVTLSEDPGGTLKKWRRDFEIAQTDLADELDISPSVVSDYESGRRENPGIDIIQRSIAALLDIDQRRGGEHIHQYTRVLSAGFDSDVVLDLR